MKILKQGQHRLFENDPETTGIVSGMLLELERDGMDAVRRYSRKFDDWDPPSFQLSPEQIRSAIDDVPQQVIQDTDFCQANVRAFAEAQLRTLLPLEVETRPGVVLGHRHIPVNSVGCYVPGGKYPLLASAHMGVLTAKVAGVKRVIACAPPYEGKPAPVGRGGQLLNPPGRARNGMGFSSGTRLVFPSI